MLGVWFAFLVLMVLWLLGVFNAGSFVVVLLIMGLAALIVQVIRAPATRHRAF